MKRTMSLFRKPINKVLGDPVKREIKRYQGVVDLINELEPEMSALTDEELRDKTREFRERLGVEGVDITHGQSFTAGLERGDRGDGHAACRGGGARVQRGVRRWMTFSPRPSRSSARRRSAPSGCATSTSS